MLVGGLVYNEISFVILFTFNNIILFTPTVDSKPWTGSCLAKLLWKTALQRRYVERTRDPGKDNIIMIVRKYTTYFNDKCHYLSYFISRMQGSKSYIKLK